MTMEQRRPGPAIGVVFSAIALTALNAAAFLLVAISWLVRPGGAWDYDVLAGLTAAALVGAGLAVLTALLTTVPVKIHWLRARWFVVPIVLLVFAVARVVYLDVSYPDLPADYGMPEMTRTLDVRPACDCGWA